MIVKDEGFKNKFTLTEDSTMKDFEEIIEHYREVHCIICNSVTSKRFVTGLFGQSIVTINNSVEPGSFYINRKY